MKLVKHPILDVFVVMVGLSMFIHSSWSMARIVGGPPPAQMNTMTFDLVRDGRSALVWFMWLLPGVMAAASIDVGLISLANTFREGRGTRNQLIVFAVLSAIRYDLQLSYTLAHSTVIDVQAGLSPVSNQVA